VFIKWTGSSSWGRAKDELFWDAAGLGLTNAGIETTGVEAANGAPDESGAGSWQVVRLEELCWVLDGAHLCEAVTGEDWKAVAARVELDTEFGEHFRRRSELAYYFVGQLKLHAAM